MIDDQQLVRSPPVRRIVGPRNDDQWIGRRGTISNPSQHPIGSITPAGMTAPNDYDQWDFNTTTDLSGVPDLTTNLQAAIDTIQASGYGGVVTLPPGVIRINGASISGGGVIVQGAGWEEYPDAFNAHAPAVRGKRGTYILTDQPASSSFTLTNTANNAQIRDIAFIQVQRPEAVGWTPVSYAPTIALAGPAGGAAIFQRLLFWGCYKPIRLAVGGSAGRITLRDISFTSFCTFPNGGGIEINDCDDLVIDNVNLFSQLLTGSPNQLTYVGNSACGMTINSAAKAKISNCSFKSSFAGIGLQGTYTSSTRPRILLHNIDINNVLRGIIENGTNVAYTALGVQCRGAATDSPCFIFDGVNPVADIDMFYGTNFNASIVATATSTGADLRFGVNCWFDFWDKLGAGNPALSVSAGNSAWYSSNSRFTNSGGGPNTGGGGTFTAY